jgi:outer membrane protein with beta-barrel domain
VLTSSDRRTRKKQRSHRCSHRATAIDRKKSSVPARRIRWFETRGKNHEEAFTELGCFGRIGSKRISSRSCAALHQGARDGGLAAAGVNVRYQNNNFTPAFLASKSDTKYGWTAGFGAEYALGANWSVKAEYLRVMLGDTTTNVPIDQFFGPGSTGL